MTDLEKVKEDGWALQHVENQTPEICLMAVKRYGCALQYVKVQTPEICLAALEQDGEAIQYVSPYIAMRALSLLFKPEPENVELCSRFELMDFD